MPAGKSRRTFLLALGAVPVSLSAVVTPRDSLLSIEHKVFDAINFQRAAYDVALLALSEPLTATARMHSARMLQARFFGHDDPTYGDLGTRMATAGIAYRRCGENVFREKNYDDPVSLAVVHWMYSEGHRENILQPEFTLTGVGAALENDGTVAITQQFLRPLD